MRGRKGTTRPIFFFFLCYCCCLVLFDDLRTEKPTTTRLELGLFSGGAMGAGGFSAKSIEKGMGLKKKVICQQQHRRDESYLSCSPILLSVGLSIARMLCATLCRMCPLLVLLCGGAPSVILLAHKKNKQGGTMQTIFFECYQEKCMQRPTC